MYNKLGTEYICKIWRKEWQRKKDGEGVESDIVLEHMFGLHKIGKEESKSGTRCIHCM